METYGYQPGELVRRIDGEEVTMKFAVLELPENGFVTIAPIGLPRRIRVEQIEAVHFRKTRPAYEPEPA